MSADAIIIGDKASGWNRLGAQCSPALGEARQGVVITYRDWSVFLCASLSGIRVEENVSTTPLAVLVDNEADLTGFQLRGGPAGGRQRWTWAGLWHGSSTVTLAQRLHSVLVWPHRWPHWQLTNKLPLTVSCHCLVGCFESSCIAAIPRSPTQASVVKSGWQTMGINKIVYLDKGQRRKGLPKSQARVIYVNAGEERHEADS